ncbi:DUF1145 domain-containing protein [Shewanella livingstonensis]|uniref:DUF1145 domain-containing protein n=1 Tax=Shewanella livingstonensis TaxID=150120 RepID=A0A3G8LZF8_9GAMM|nr:DUF1145 domain-containing protein [Shewanella livingstonensis]AZG75036.1 DUF1145 domain-containing protein [Shewanella livingstonensis]
MLINSNDIVLIGKTATVSMWSLVAYGLVVFSQDVSLLINLFASVTVIIHILLVLLTKLTSNSKSAAYYRAILLWGVFAILEQYHLQHPRPQPSNR